MNRELKEIKRRKASSLRKTLRNYLIVIARDKDTELTEKLPKATWRDIGACFRISAQRAKDIYDDVIARIY